MTMDGSILLLKGRSDMKYYFDNEFRMKIPLQSIIKSIALTIAVLLTLSFHVWTITGTFNVMHDSSLKNTKLMNTIDTLQTEIRGKDIIIKSLKGE